MEFWEFFSQDIETTVQGMLDLTFVSTMYFANDMLFCSQLTIRNAGMLAVSKDSR